MDSWKFIKIVNEIATVCLLLAIKIVCLIIQSPYVYNTNNKKPACCFVAKDS